MHSMIHVNNIWAEDLFQWFSNSIIRDGGDGAGIIICQNYQEVATWFEQWCKEKAGWGMGYPRNEYEVMGIRYVNYHDENENFMFSNKKEAIFRNGWGDYSFLVVGDCKFGFDHSGRIIKAVELRSKYEISCCGLTSF